MGTYRSSHPMMSEANRTASIPHLPWAIPTARTVYNPFPAMYYNVDAIPVRSVTPVIAPPPTELPNNANGVVIEDTKAKKPKISKKTSNNVVSKALKPKQIKKDPAKPSKKAKITTTTTTTTVPVAKRERKDLNFVTYGGNVDISGLPAPFCSCTGISRQCYRWGAGGWQSSCCTINISEHPLPMSVTRPGSRMAGRKMSSGAYEKLLQRRAAEGYDLSQPIDLKEHWARHGTNKFVTIK